MRFRCPECRDKLTCHSSDIKWLDAEYVPTECKAIIARIYRFTCKQTADCGLFFVLSFRHEDDMQKPPQHQLRDDGQALWNQGQVTKPRKDPMRPVVSIYTTDIKKDTGHAFENILRRERRYFRFYGQPGDFLRSAAENRKRLQKR